MRFFDEYLLTKRCTSCDEVKLYVDFHRSPKGGRSGRKSKYTTCVAAVAKEYRQRPEVKAAACRHSQRFYAKNRARAHAWNMEWSREHRESRRENSRRHYENNRQAYIENARAWAAANREQRRSYQNEYSRRRYAAERGSAVEPIDRGAVWARDGGTCHICGQACEPDNWHMDHVAPIARGGAHVMDNVAVSHPACNRRKFTRLMEELKGVV